ncbi:MAG: S9 family peptidase [Desulfovibrio sp.]|nr:MAG: S9 family peptidase [Desulfovibrio sp.]
MLLSLVAFTVAASGCVETSPSPDRNQVQVGEAEEHAPDVIPVEDFFRNPQRSQFQFSPDGQYISFMMPWFSRLNIYVQRIGEDRAFRITEARNRDIVTYEWANDHQIVYAQDRNGDENYHAFLVNVDGSNRADPIDLTPYDDVRVALVDRLENDDQHMLISTNQRDARVFDVYRINLETLDMELVAENPGNVVTWMTDNDGQLRLAVATDGVNRSILYRTTEDHEFRELLSTNFKDFVGPLFFDFDNKNIYVVSNIGRDRQAIFLFDPEANEFLDLIYEHDEVDVSRLFRSEEREIITAVSYFTDVHHYHFFDEQRAELQADLESRLPGYEVGISDMNEDETKLLIVAYNSQTRGGFWYYDLTTGEFTKLVDISPWIEEEDMCEVLPVSYEARDGLTIHGYLTLPRGVEPENLPVVILPHGGPSARDFWRFNPDVQFLANRGMAVLQVNFRGSVGFGKEFWSAGFNEWGLAMQDDLSDGVQWLIDQGIADPERVAIYGASYGGYAALAGLCFTPELYSCGVSYAGPSNLFTLLENIPPYWEPARDMFYEQIGHPEEDAERLRAVSPVFHADLIEDPLFVVQGGNDPRVSQLEADQIVEALEGRGIAVDYLLVGNEGHGFSNEENRFEFYYLLEQFLAEHLGTRVYEGEGFESPGLPPGMADDENSGSEDKEASQE